MKSIFSSRLRRRRLYLTAFLVLLSAAFPLLIVWQTAQMQKAPLSFADVIFVLRSKKVSLSQRNELLTAAVRERGIDFKLIEEFEKELSKNGASPELIAAIRQKSLKPQASSAPVPTPTTIAATAPKLTPDSAFYRQRGDEYYAAGEYERAISEYDQAIRLNQQDVAAYYSRGFAYHYKNNQDRAFENYKTAIRLKSELAQEPTMQCVLYNPAKRGNTDKAIEECSKTISSFANFALAYYVRGNAYLDQEEPDRAVADFNKFIELNPKNALAYVSRGDAYWDKEDYDRAAADYNKAIELDTNNETAKKNLQRLQTELLNIAESKRAIPAYSPNAGPAQIVSVGELNSRAERLVKPSYPEDAKKMFMQGKVTVQITIDENGNVIAAKANSGKALLRFYAETAAHRSKFEPVMLNNQAVKATGFIVYNFTLP
jgi:TonB family protein